MLARLSGQAKIGPDPSIRRALYVAAFIVFWMLAIGARLVHVQVSSHDDLVERARKQQQGTIETCPQRGRLLDRQERELARSIDTESVFAAPYEIEDVEHTAEQLAPIVEIDKATLRKQLADAKNSDKKFVWIARRLANGKAEKLRTLDLPGIHFRKEPKRYYPNGSLAAHVLGFVGLDGMGLGGIEQVYDHEIAGEPGKLFLETDSHGEPYESFEIASQPGQTVVLTIDQAVQFRAEQALVAAVARSHAKSGTAIVLDPRTGEILAFANVPTFDPNNAGASSPEARANWALQNIYEPGSTFKIVAFSAAIEKGLVKPENRVDCQMGAITVAGRLIHDHHAFGVLTIAEALARSSNVAAIKLGLRVGDETMYDFITRFGFGSRTGVELPGETPGLVRTVSHWQPSSIGSIAMGQEVGVTALQMAAAFSALANNGLQMPPHLVREIRSPFGAVVYRPNREQRRVISSETANALRAMLEAVTLNGTAKKAQLNGYSAAGKTGTAQKIDPKTKTYSQAKHVASFVGFAPVQEPAVVIIVVIDEPAGLYHGGDVAAPVFREIAEQILPDLGIAPDTEFKLPDLIAGIQPKPELGPGSRDAQIRQHIARNATLPQLAYSDANGELVYAAATKNAIVMPDLRGCSVRDVARACAQLGLQVEAHGEGQALRQNPTPGMEVESGQIVYVDFGRAN
jgi:cell division protein FtsI/penicillin-binding protein 2